jgi:hypothetical protein
MSEDPEAPPPVLSSWARVYLVVLAELALLVTLFWVLTRCAA